MELVDDSEVDRRESDPGLMDEERDDRVGERSQLGRKRRIDRLDEEMKGSVNDRVRQTFSQDP